MIRLKGAGEVEEQAFAVDILWSLHGICVFLYQDPPVGVPCLEAILGSVG